MSIDVASASRLVTYALSLGLLACGALESGFAPADTTTIQQADVERVLTALASDDMRGRAAFSADAMRAAEYLAGEFADAGLQDTDGNGFVQRFSVRSLRAGEARVALNGRTLAADQFVVRLGAPSLRWTAAPGTLVQVGGTDDVQAVMSEIRSATGGALVLIPPARMDLFRTLAGFFGRPVRSLNQPTPPQTEGDSPSIVLAIWEGAAEPSVDIEATALVTDEPLANVVGVLPGRRSNEFVLFSAHYDHIGIRPTVNGDSIANGANDDASGTTAVVELARYFAGRGTPERTLLFAAFTAEEAGGYGSRYFSSQLDPGQIVAMFNIEMIGKPAVEGPNTAWITGFERSSFGALLQDAVEGSQYRFYPDPYPDQNLFYRSDNATLARLGVPAHSISTTPIDVDPDYHQVSDEIETLNLEHMTNTIRAIATAAEGMVAGAATPTRVDPASIDSR